MQKNYLTKLIVGLFLIIGFTTMSFSQISEGGTPKSFEIALDKASVDKITIENPNVEQLKSEDEFFEKNGMGERCGISLSVGVSPENAGTWTELKDGSRIWRLEISSKGAEAIGLYYNQFQIPVNGKLFIYSADKKHLIGAFTSKNNPKHKEFATEAIYGDDIIIEYNETPANYGVKRISYEKDFKLSISHIGYFYKGFIDYSKANEKVNESDACEVNINCSPVGDDWQDEKRGVARILFKEGTSYYWCSGSLINNTSQDCTPYFLTAYHCGAVASASDHNQWIFYFNYESPDCDNPTSDPTSNSITGCTLKTTSGIDGGSDLQLLELSSSPLDSWNTYYNGWSLSTSGPTSGAGIHHPSGDIKKISTYSTTLTASSPNIGGSQMQTNSAWQVTWSSNPNGWGVTEGGSSGSPIFDANGLIVGTLSGGSSYCTAQSASDYYGRFSYHWTNGGLATYLDPTNTGATSFLGTNTPCTGAGVLANFTASATTITVGSSVTFTDQSAGAITSRDWSFDGGTPSTSSATNPVVAYDVIGTYDVSLTVSDGTVSDTETKTAYINVVAAGTTCDTLDTYGLATSSATLYGVAVADGGGYLSGTNGYADTKKANFYDHALTVNTVLEGVDFYFARATSGTNPNITFEILDGSTGSPGSVIASVVKPLAEIEASLGSAYYVDFGGVDVTSDFFVSFSCGLDMASGDTIAIISNADGDVSDVDLAWDEWNNSWSRINTNWGLTISFAMFPILCPEVTGIKDINNPSVNIYPNPTTGILNIEGINNYNKLLILDIQGKIVKTYTDFTNTINISDLQKGNYIIRILSDDNVITKKLTLIK